VPITPRPRHHSRRRLAIAAAVLAAATALAVPAIPATAQPVGHALAVSAIASDSTPGIAAHGTVKYGGVATLKVDNRQGAAVEIQRKIPGSGWQDFRVVQPTTTGVAGKKNVRVRIWSTTWFRVHYTTSTEISPIIKIRLTTGTARQRALTDALTAMCVHVAKGSGEYPAQSTGNLTVTWTQHGGDPSSVRARMKPTGLKSHWDPTLEYSEDGAHVIRTGGFTTYYSSRHALLGVLQCATSDKAHPFPSYGENLPSIADLGQTYWSFTRGAWHMDFSTGDQWSPHPCKNFDHKGYPKKLVPKCTIDPSQGLAGPGNIRTPKR
jgi:hypothetical protein